MQADRHVSVAVAAVLRALSFARNAMANTTSDNKGSASMLPDAQQVAVPRLRLANPTDSPSCDEKKRGAGSGASPAERVAGHSSSTSGAGGASSASSWSGVDLFAASRGTLCLAVSIGTALCRLSFTLLQTCLSGPAKPSRMHIASTVASLRHPTEPRALQSLIRSLSGAGLLQDAAQCWTPTTCPPTAARTQRSCGTPPPSGLYTDRSDRTACATARRAEQPMSVPATPPAQQEAGGQIAVAAEALPAEESDAFEDENQPPLHCASLGDLLDADDLCTPGHEQAALSARPWAPAEAARQSPPPCMRASGSASACAQELTRRPPGTTAAPAADAQISHPALPPADARNGSAVMLTNNNALFEPAGCTEEHADASPERQAHAGEVPAAAAQHAADAQQAEPSSPVHSAALQQLRALEHLDTSRSHPASCHGHPISIGSVQCADLSTSELQQLASTLRCPTPASAHAGRDDRPCGETWLVPAVAKLQSARAVDQQSEISDAGPFSDPMSVISRTVPEPPTQPAVNRKTDSARVLASRPRTVGTVTPLQQLPTNTPLPAPPHTAWRWQQQQQQDSTFARPVLRKVAPQHTQRPDKELGVAVEEQENGQFVSAGAAHGQGRGTGRVAKLASWFAGVGRTNASKGAQSRPMSVPRDAWRKAKGVPKQSEAADAAD